MSQEADQAIGLIKWWQELTVLFVAMLGLFGITRKKGAGKLLVTRDHFDEKMETLDSKMTQGFSDVYKRIDEKTDYINNRFDNHIDKN